eukprot:SAG11_NODE_5474_length_1550_cov_66.057202_3_plen_63_part_00
MEVEVVVVGPMVEVGPLPLRSQPNTSFGTHPKVGPNCCSFETHPWVPMGSTLGSTPRLWDRP